MAYWITDARRLLLPRTLAGRLVGRGRATYARTRDCLRAYRRICVVPLRAKAPRVCLGAHGPEVLGQAHSRRHARRRTATATDARDGAEGSGLPLVPSD